MAGRASQLGFEFKQESLPSRASVELAATRARARAGSMSRVQHDGATLEKSSVLGTTSASPPAQTSVPEDALAAASDD